jgi:uncharacterized protein (TIRG00374 family)
MGRIKINEQPSPTLQNQSRSDWRRLLPGLVISGLSLALVFYFADLRKLGAALRLADYRYVLLAAFITLGWLMVRGLVWRTLLQDQASYGAVFWTLNEGYLLNNILPFRLGEVGRAFLLGRKSHLAFWQVLSSVLIERILDLALAVGLLFSTLPFVVGATWARQAALGVGGFVVLGFLLLYGLAHNQRLAMTWFERLKAHIPFLERFGGRALVAFFSGLNILTDGKRFLRALGWVMLNWGMAVVQYVVMVWAFFPEAKFLWGTFVLGVAALGIAAPSSPGAVGVFELSVVGALSLFKQDASTALALAITLHLVQVLLTGVLGAMALARDGESLLGLYRSLRNQRLSVVGGDDE